VAGDVRRGSGAVKDRRAAAVSAIPVVPAAVPGVRRRPG
jgi:hypothetical protein